MSVAPPSTYVAELVRLLASVAATDGEGVALSFDAGVTRCVDRLLQLKKTGAKVMLIGNGGSASVAGHMQMDLVNGVGVKAMCFHDIPTLTALANDHGYVVALERGVRLWASAGDLLVAVSSSGRSENILRAVSAARDAGCDVVTLSGFAADNPLRQRGVVNFWVASGEYGPVETVHACIAHMLTDVAIATGVDR